MEECRVFTSTGAAGTRSYSCVESAAGVPVGAGALPASPGAAPASFPPGSPDEGDTLARAGWVAPTVSRVCVVPAAEAAGRSPPDDAALPIANSQSSYGCTRVF